MSQKIEESKLAAPEQKEVQLPLLALYHQQLQSFNGQKNQVQIQLQMVKSQLKQLKAQFYQLDGAIFTCEKMIKLYEEEVKKNVAKLMNNKDVTSTLDDNENQGAINNGQAKQQEKK